ncbi:MAG: TldD/PmbA family protein [Brevefilum sp.]
MQHDQVKSYLQNVRTCIGEETFEATLHYAEDANLRFTDNYIHQNAYGDQCLLTVRVQKQGRLGEAFTRQLTEEAIHQAVEKARRIAAQPHAPDIGYPFTGEDEIYHPSHPVRLTLGIDPRDLGKHVEKAILTAGQEKLTASGIIASSKNIMGYISSNAGPISGDFQSAWMNVLLADDEKQCSGWTSMAACDPQDIDSDRLISDALAKVKLPKSEKKIPPGLYRVILDHHAAAEVLALLSDCCFAGSSFHGDGLISEKNKGKQVFHPSLSMWEDAGDPAGCPVAFDFEGVPKQKVSLIERGRIAGAVYDRAAAIKADLRSTGHAISREKPFIVGPSAQNLFVDPGTQNLDEMVELVHSGLLISRFQYTTLIDHEKLVIAATTRDGTLLIENGEVTAVLPNLSFRLSVIDLLQGEVGFDDDRRLMKMGSGFIATPRMFVENFKII